MIPMPRENAPLWRDDEMLECVSVIPEAPGVATFSFRPPSGSVFHFRAGQFLTLDLPVPGNPVSRTFTISSSPTSTAYVSVTVKLQEGSIGTRWMMDHLRPGMQIRAHGPAGVFHLPRQPDGQYLFIGAGSGVTPLHAMTNFLWERGESPDITFISVARRPSDLIFRRRLEYMASRSPGLKLAFVVKDEDPFDAWTGYRGRFNQLMLGLMAPDYLDRDVYCCGPESFMDSVREMLISLGYDMDRYHQENFHAAAQTIDEIPDLEDYVPDDEAKAEITFATSGVTATCLETDTVLQIAKASGLNIPNGCNFGVCGTCKVRKLSGDVHMIHNGGISEDDIDAGYILACCSKPVGKIEVAV